jgi:hypothetical protein
MTAKAASAARVLRSFSEPGCLDAIDGAIAAASSEMVGRGVGDRVETTIAGICQQVITKPRRKLLTF